jgi:LCP family protein required for cell wall assembly
MPTTIARYARRAVLGLVACVAVLALTGLAGAIYVDHQLGQVHRIHGVFDGIGPRPYRPTSGPAAEAVNVLLLGTDRRSDVATTGSAAPARAWVPGEQRSDAMMLVHVAADRSTVTVVSLPRDSWVDVPGYGMAKINAAYSYGGASLAVRTVERLTDIRLDHLAVVDWTGFRDLTDAVGGVTVRVPQTVHDSARDITWTAGVHHLDGQQALDFVGQRYGLTGGDLDRVRRQQEVLGKLAQATLGMREDPRLALDFVRMLTEHVSVDDRWSSRDLATLAWSLRHVGDDDVRYLTAPVADLGWEGDQSVVHLDARAGDTLWRAIRDDRLEGWAGRHPESDTPVP